MTSNKMLTIEKSVTEQQLLRGCLRGDAASQRTLYDRMAPRMLGTCIRYVRDRSEAEHVMVGGMVKVFSKLTQFNGEGSFEGWIRRIMVNECLMYLRKNQNMSLEVDMDAAERMPNLDKVDAYMDMDILMGFIRDLPIGYRTVFNLYAIEGFGHAEIAAMLSISENTSKSQLSRARRLLQNKLRQLEDRENESALNHGSK